MVREDRSTNRQERYAHKKKIKPRWLFNSYLNLLTLFIFYLLNRAGVANQSEGVSRQATLPPASYMKGKRMEKQTEQKFYERLNKIDADDDYWWLAGHCICAISGSVVGFLIGYFLGAM